MEHPNPGTIGDSTKRTEDRRFLTGQGRYTDDIKLEGMVHAAIVRSQYGHGKINAINADDARAMDGVLAVFTGQDLLDDGVQSIPTGWQIGDEMKEPPHYAVAVDKVRHVGDPVAVVG